MNPTNERIRKEILALAFEDREALLELLEIELYEERERVYGRA
jgi:hypothetical protein